MWFDLVAFGNVLGRQPHCRAEADRHALNEFTVLVGLTSKGRKGSSSGHIEHLLARVDSRWTEQCIQWGLSSGEGLIWAVRDPLIKKAEVIDKGVTDKRLFVLEAEFASTLRVLGREGNTLSSLIRQAWDGKTLASMTKNSPGKATGAHVSIVGHITRDEQTSPTFPVHMWGVNRILSGIGVFDKQPSHIEQKNSQTLVMGSIDISGLMRIRQDRLNSPPVYRKC